MKMQWTFFFGLRSFHWDGEYERTLRFYDDVMKQFISSDTLKSQLLFTLGNEFITPTTSETEQSPRYHHKFDMNSWKKITIASHAHIYRQKC